MVKANHLLRRVKGNLRNTKNVVDNFLTCTGGRYGGLLLDLYGSTFFNIVYLIHIHISTKY